MTNFSFLETKPAYSLFAPACMEAEKIYSSAPAMCAVGCRKALELAVKWVYATDKSMKMPYNDNLQSLIHEPTFRFAVDSDTWGKFPFIIKLGNLAVHTERSVQPSDVLLFERVRKELRELIHFLDKGSGEQKRIVTKLTDPIIDSQEGIQLDAAYDFEDYRSKVNRYVNEHSDTLAIHKLTHNIPLTLGDYQELERILTSELGSKEDYAREFGDTPFGLLIRKIAKLDHEAAMQAFSSFINDQSLNQQQIAFVNKIIHHIELNGYMENVAELTRLPFDKPVSFIKLFDAKTRTSLLETINQVRENAVQITAS